MDVSSNSWSLTLNILKLIGAGVTGAAALIGILSETKTADKKHLTRAGKVLLVIGIVGFGTALGAQIVEWIKGTYDAQEAQKRNAAMLSEIRRAVSRFDTASYDVYVELPIDKPDLARYKDHLNKRLEELELLPHLRWNHCYRGVKLLFKQHMEEWDNATIGVCTEGLPSEREDGSAATFINTIPAIKLYKHPVEFPSVSAPDLQLVPMPQNTVPSLTGRLNFNGDLETLSSIRYGVDAPYAKWSPSGNLVSVEDLVGAQAAVYLPGNEIGGLAEVWKATHVRVEFYFNNQRISPDRNAVSVTDEPMYVFTRGDVYGRR